MGDTQYMTALTLVSTGLGAFSQPVCRIRIVLDGKIVGRDITSPIEGPHA